MKHNNSLKLGLKATKPAFKSFYLKIENESNLPTGIIGMIEPLSSMFPLSINSRGCFKKS